MREKPGWCSQEVWDAAYAYAAPAAETATRNLDYDDVTIEVHAIRMAVARAFLAERERCAKVAEDRAPAIQCISVEPVVSACLSIAAAIRKGGE